MKKTPTKLTPNKKRKAKGINSTPKRDRSKGITIKRSDLQFPELDDDYEILTQIARGTYGIVYKARAKGYEADTYFACKRMFSTVSCGLIVMESEIARRLNKYHISPQIYDLVQKSGHYSLIFEYVPHDYFVEYINDLTLTDIKYYMYQLL